MLNFENDIRSQLSEQGLEPIGELIPVSGGDINYSYKVQSKSGPIFVKYQAKAPEKWFEVEVEGLNILGKHVPIPNVLFQTRNLLALDCLEATAKSEKMERRLAMHLAAIHSQEQDFFGWNRDNYIGHLAQSNSPSVSGSEFYAEQRLLPLAKQALQMGLMTAADVQKVSKLCERLEHILPKENPVLLHGDLWAGNVFFGENEVYLIDPAVYYGYRETDIAMTMLFGGFSAAFYDEYNNLAPLSEGWKERMLLFQIYPLLVHLLLFGSGYHGQVMHAVKRYF